MFAASFGLGFIDFVFNLFIVMIVFIQYWLVQKLIFQTNPNIHWTAVIMIAVIGGIITMMISQYYSVTPSTMTKKMTN